MTITKFATVTAAFFSLVQFGGGYAHALDTPHVQKQEAPKVQSFDSTKFDRSVIIDNKWMTMIPGTRWIYEGTTVEDDGKVVPHRIEITVTDLYKVISGVRTLVSYDLDYSDGELVEAELAFYAQDNDGNVWRFGEYPEEYEDGKLVQAPAWIDGLEGAKAGIMMQANPRLGTPSYAQGFGPAVDWTDRGKVHQIGQKVSVKAGRYEDVLVIAETSESEKDAYQLKYYAPGVGNIRVGWMGDGEKNQETLELVRIDHLDQAELEQIRIKALKLESSAYKESKNVYGRTPAVFWATSGARR